ncbi:ketopantoate reductase C-terminal domain-containing protein [Bradyrhizobium guangdongense]
MPAETIARAGEGVEASLRACDQRRFRDAKYTSSEQRPSTGHDMQKGRFTEVEFLNGFVVNEGRTLGIACPVNAALTHIFKRVDLGELKPDPKHINELRLN